jgi:enoyl-CoA hydratase
MPGKTVLVDRPRPNVALVTLNRPDTLNSETVELVQELSATFDTLADDASVRVVILTGAGRGFCSGHDMAEMAGVGGPYTTQQAWANQTTYANLTLKLRDFPKPVIAAVNGPAAGGGLALALASDTRVCSESARFNAAFVKLGISGCDVGVSYLLPKIVGPTLAFEMMLTGRIVDAEEAARSGLVLKVVPDGEVVDAALEIADAICANAPFAVEMTKEVMWTNLDAPDLRSAIDLENRTQIVCVGTREIREAVAAFLEKRPAVFQDASG